jgi:hypothetical protein
MFCNICVTSETLLGKVKDTVTELVKWSGASTGLSEVRWTRTTVGGSNDLGGSITAGIGVKPISLDIMRHFKKNFQILIQENFFRSHLATFWSTHPIRPGNRVQCIGGWESMKVDSIIMHASCLKTILMKFSPLCRYAATHEENCA